MTVNGRFWSDHDSMIQLIDIPWNILIIRFLQAQEQEESHICCGYCYPVYSFLCTSISYYITMHLHVKKIKDKRYHFFVFHLSYVFMFFCSITYVYHKFSALDLASFQEHNRLKEFGSQEEDSDCHFFVLDEIITATNNFSCSNEIGEGGFGRVYKVNFR